jgi:hypothetical protein
MHLETPFLHVNAQPLPNRGEAGLTQTFEFCAGK